MRLSEGDKKSIIEGVSTQVNRRFPFELYLVGSRTQDHTRGGDIDLLLVLSSANDSALLRNEKENFLNEIKKRIGDCRVDLTITDPETLKTQPVQSLMMKTAILLTAFS